MNKKQKIIVSVLFILSFTTLCKSEEVGLLPIPIFKEAGMRSQLMYDTAVDLYTYKYTVSSPPTNTGKIWAIAIDISQPLGGIILNSEGLTIPRGGEAGDIVTYEEELPSQSLKPIPSVPVGMRVPYGWGGGLGAAGTALFAADAHASEIFPGKILSGFEMISRGLPAIRNITIEPWWIYVQSEDISAEEAQQEDQRAREIEASLPFKTKTIGPTAPPADFKPTDFLTSIINMKHDAYKLGWIKNEGILKSLDAKLDNAKKDIEKGNTRSAKNTLKAFISEVEAQGCESYENCLSGKHLTSEAYGLLKYNAQYLIDRL